ncbi:MAG: hypothetical protein K8R68_07145 [Bacteroidales bacterium]|nr:hypothetical protein [Bacteroidales bacterium]
MVKIFPEVKPFGVQVYNTRDGSLAWESEEFKKGITNAISLNNYHIVCNSKSLFSIDINTGENLYEVPVSKIGVGDAEMILKYKEDIIVVIGKKGIATFNPENGELINAGKYKEAVLEDRIDNIVIMKTDKSDIAAFDLNTCKYKYFKAKSGATTTLSKGGEFVYVYEKKTISKVKTRE